MKANFNVEFKPLDDSSEMVIHIKRLDEEAITYQDLLDVLSYFYTSILTSSKAGLEDGSLDIPGSGTTTRELM